MVAVGLRLTGTRRSYSTAERTSAAIEANLRSPKRNTPPRALSRSVHVEARDVAGTTVHTLSPRKGGSRHHVVFLHGGGYIHELNVYHWLFAHHLTRQAPARVEIPIYTLAPQATADVTVPATADVLTALLVEADGPTTVIGDSAGGGLALAVVEVLRDRGAPLPAHLVLIAPWLDITVSHPRQKEIAPRDAMLAVPGLAEAGRRYAGHLDLLDPLVSPLHGDLRGLPPTDVFVGTADLLHPDSVEFVRRARDAGLRITLHEAPDMQHDYPLNPLLRECRAARSVIVGLVQAQSTGPATDRNRGNNPQAG